MWHNIYGMENKSNVIIQKEKQIKALEFALIKSVNNPTANPFALNNKIKKLKTEIEEIKKYEWLAK